MLSFLLYHIFGIRSVIYDSWQRAGLSSEGLVYGTYVRYRKAIFRQYGVSSISRWGSCRVPGPDMHT